VSIITPNTANSEEKHAQDKIGLQAGHFGSQLAYFFSLEIEWSSTTSSVFWKEPSAN